MSMILFCKMICEVILLSEHICEISPISHTLLVMNFVGKHEYVFVNRRNISTFKPLNLFTFTHY